MPVSPVGPKGRISVDGWAVIVALAAALLVRIGLLKVMPW